MPPGKKQQVTKLRKALKESKDLYLATDEDREGEAISWHLCELLKPKVPVHRLVFHEITQAGDRGVRWTIPVTIDEGLVRAQETRRILDRLYGYDVSQLLWKKVGPGLSAGTRAECGRAPDRGTRTRADGSRFVDLLGFSWDRLRS